MRVYSIPEHVLAAKYRGSGYALAASGDGRALVDLIYLRDALPDFDDPSEAEGDDVAAVMERAVNDPRLRPAIEQLRAQGAALVGMCSAC